MRKDRNGEAFSDGVIDLTCNGKCTQCGQCCSNLLPMTDEEIAVIHKYIKRHHIVRYIKSDQRFAKILYVVLKKNQL